MIECFYAIGNNQISILIWYQSHTFLCTKNFNLSVRFSHFNRKLTRVERHKIKDFLLSSAIGKSYFSMHKKALNWVHDAELIIVNIM